MRKHSLLSASVLALAVGTSATSADTSVVIDQIVADLSAQGFVRIEIDIERDGTFDVDAFGGGREGDFYFDAAGNLLSSDIDDNEIYGVSYTGDSPVAVDLDDDYDDDDYDDDDYDDDDDDDDYEDDEDDDDDDEDDSYGDDDYEDGDDDEEDDSDDD